MFGENYVFGTIFRASGFVLRNLGPCLLRALPVIILAAVLHLPQLQETLSITFLPELLEPFAYAVFAVAWHRYTILSSERQRNGLIPRFGLRELKFGLVSLAITLALLAITEGFSLILGEGPTFIFITVLIYFIAGIGLMFVFPAIAFDQPVDMVQFIQEALKLLGSLIVAILLASVVVAILVGSFIFAASSIAETSQNPVWILLSAKFFIEALFGTLILAIAISMFKDVIGLKEDKSSDLEGTTAP
jgi:flagellar biosynthesis protein FliQ